MVAYLIKRLGLAAVTLLFILFVSYLLVRLAPGDPTKSAVIGGADIGAAGVSERDGALGRNEALRRKLFLDDPVYVGFFHWLAGVLTRGDFGESASVDKGRPVTSLVLERLPITVFLNLVSVLIIYLLSIPIGVYSAVRPDARGDTALTFLLFFLYSLPSFWVALVLQSALCQGGYLPIFPLKGVASPQTWGVDSWTILWRNAQHYVLPIFCLSYAGFAGLSRYARGGMLDIIRQDYIRTARAKGVSEMVVVMKHALRNAMVILVTLFAGLLPGLVAGSIIVEHVFNIPGMGSLSMMALSSRDIPLLMAIFGFSGALTLAGILLADILYVIVDPRINFDARK